MQYFVILSCGFSGFILDGCVFHFIYSMFLLCYVTSLQSWELWTKLSSDLWLWRNALWSHNRRVHLSPWEDGTLLSGRYVWKNILLIFSIMISVWVISWKGSNALMLSKHITFLTLSNAAAPLFSLCLKLSLRPPPSWKSPVCSYWPLCCDWSTSSSACRKNWLPLWVYLTLLGGVSEYPLGMLVTLTT